MKREFEIWIGNICNSIGWEMRWSEVKTHFTGLLLGNIHWKGRYKKRKTRQRKGRKKEKKKKKQAAGGLCLLRLNCMRNIFFIYFLFFNNLMNIFLGPCTYRKIYFHKLQIKKFGFELTRNLGLVHTQESYNSWQFVFSRIWRKLPPPYCNYWIKKKIEWNFSLFRFGKFKGRSKSFMMYWNLANYSLPLQIPNSGGNWSVSVKGEV